MFLKILIGILLLCMVIVICLVLDEDGRWHR